MIDVFGVKKLAVIIHPVGPSIFSTLGNHMKSCKFYVFYSSVPYISESFIGNFFRIISSFGNNNVDD